MPHLHNATGVMRKFLFALLIAHMEHFIEHLRVMRADARHAA
jgi:hypothetical protein